MTPTTAYASSGDKASLFARIGARAPTYWRYLRENPSWILMFLFARTLFGRRVERWFHRAAYRKPQPVEESLLQEIDLSRTVGDIIADGVALGLRLPTHIVREISDFAQSTPCFARDSQQDGFLPRDVAEANRSRDRDVIAGYYFEAVDKSPPITRLSRDPALLSIARAYIGSEPVLIRTRLWWSFPAERVSDADLHAAAQDRFHFDMNGWRTLKFFFYLTATTDRGGAHRCILGSHRRRHIMHQLTPIVGRAIEDLRAYYDESRFLTVVGDAGFGFAEDPFIFHTGSLCEDHPRLILEIEYGASAVSPSYRYGRLG